MSTIEESSPPSAGSLLARARVLLEARRPGEAIGVLHRALAAEPGDWQALCLLSLAFLQVGQPADALVTAGHAAAANPASDWPHRLRASALVKLERVGEALAEAKQAVAVDPGIQESYIILTEAEVANRHFAEARAAAEQARALAPERCGGHVALSMVELKARRWTQAEMHARAALAIDPENTAALNNLGVALQGLGQRREAVHYLGTASRLDPRNPLYRRNAVGAATRFGSLFLVLVVALQFVAGNVIGGLFFGAALVGARLVIMARRGRLAGLWRTPVERWRRRRTPRSDPQASPELMRALRREGGRAFRGSLTANARLVTVCYLLGASATTLVAMAFFLHVADPAVRGPSKVLDAVLAMALAAATAVIIRCYLGHRRAGGPRRPA